jgi:hypothetical protein
MRPDYQNTEIAIFFKIENSNYMVRINLTIEYTLQRFNCWWTEVYE